MIHAEHALQRSVAAFLDCALTPPVWWTSIDHAGQGWRHGAQLKARGVKAGTPDIFIFAPADNPSPDKIATKVIALELKVPGRGQSHAQEETQANLFSVGTFYSVVYSIEQVERVLRGCGVALRASVSARPANAGPIFMEAGNA